MPTWLRIAVPIAVGLALGVVVFKVTTSGLTPQVTEPPVTAAGKPAPALPGIQPPAFSTGQPPAQSAAPVEKPSPLLPKSRPTPPPLRQEPKTVKTEVAANTSMQAPSGSAARVESAPAPSVAISGTAEPAPAVREPAPAPAVAALTPIGTPARVEHPSRPAAVATVTVEPVSGSKLGRIVRRIPGFRRRNQDFVPARPIRQITPSVPEDEHLARDVPVDLKITVDPSGSVAEVEQTSRGADKQLVKLAENAARSWQFVPARRNDETVSSELILHFTFKSTNAEP